MANLANPKHEEFSRAISRGATALDAASNAGLKMNKTQAQAFSHEPKIVRRVEELRREAAASFEMDEQDLEAMSPEQVRELINPDWILKETVVSIKKSQTAGQFNATKSLLEMLGKEMGMFGGNNSAAPQHEDLRRIDEAEKRQEQILTALQHSRNLPKMTEMMKDVTPDSKFKTNKNIDFTSEDNEQ